MPEDAGVRQEVWRFTHKPVQIKNRVEIQIKVLLTYTLFNLETTNKEVGTKWSLIYNNFHLIITSCFIVNLGVKYNINTHI